MSPSLKNLNAIFLDSIKFLVAFIMLYAAKNLFEAKKLACKFLKEYIIFCYTFFFKQLKWKKHCYYKI